MVSDAPLQQAGPAPVRRDPLDRLSEWFRALFERLGSSPAGLLCAALALNALAQPYAGFQHDSRLYAAQVSERVHPGSFHDDLYLLYGSQDRYSLFSPLVTPLVRVLGLSAGFFVLYLASKCLLFWGAQRLTAAVVRDRAATVLSVLFLALTPLPLGGNGIFHLNEQFLTPRLAACGLVLLGLERMLAGRFQASLLALAGAFLLHPLMALGGGLIFLAWWLSQRLTAGQAAGLVLALGLLAGAVLGCEPLGRRVFGHMEGEWRDVATQMCFYIKPRAWGGADWARIGWGFLVVGAGAAWFARGASRFLLSVLGTALLGLLGSLIAVRSHYLLLIQTSPYRALWVLEFLALPLGFLGVVKLWRRGTGRARAASLALLLAVTGDWRGMTLVALGLFPVLVGACAVYHRGLGRRPRRPDWLGPSAAAGFAAVVVLLLAAAVVTVVALLSPPTDAYADFHPALFLSVGTQIVPKLPALLLACALLLPGVAFLGRGWQFRAAMLGVWLCYQTAFSAVADSSWYGERYSKIHNRARFLAAYLKSHPPPDRRVPTLYWPVELRYLWFDLGAHSYFHWFQMSGCAFNRETAIEGKRRALLVKRFETARLSKLTWVTADWRSALEEFYHASGPSRPPTREDLLGLCRDEVLDLVVIEERFDGLYSATDGLFYIYDCRRLRSHLAAREASGLAAR